MERLTGVDFSVEFLEEVHFDWKMEHDGRRDPEKFPLDTFTRCRLCGWVILGGRESIHNEASSAI